MGYFINSLIDMCAMPFALVGLVLAIWLALRLVVWATERRQQLDFDRAMHREEVQAATLENQKKAVELEKQKADIALVAVDPTRPMLDRAGLEAGGYSQAMLLLAAKYLETLQPVQPVPTTLHYAPHYARITEQTTAALPLPTVPQLEAKPAGDFWQLYTGGLLPDKGFLMGYSLEDGKPVTATWKDLYSALIGGQSGSGKSTLIRSVLAQSALQGGKFAVLDPHFGAGEESLGASLLPLRGLMMCDVAGSERAMLDTVKLFVHIGQRRLRGDTDRQPHILIVDELTSLLSRSSVAGELNDLLGMIAQETRKVGVFALCIGQQFHSDFFDTTTRNSFVSYVGCRMRRDVARVMTGSKSFADIAEQLVIGQAVWMTPGGEVHRLSVPNCRQADIEMIAQRVTSGEGDGAKVVYTPVNHPQIEAGDKPLVNHSETTYKPPGANELRVIELFKSGATIAEIVRDVFNATTGKPYTDGVFAVQAIIRDTLNGGK